MAPISVILLIFLFMLGCAGPAHYRTGVLDDSQKPCPLTFTAGAALQPDNKEVSLGPHWRCFDQEHEVSADTGYSLNFLEFDENGALHDDRQFDRISARLTEHPQTFMLIFVHGWRHDAAYENQNVEAFRTLLAYSSAFLAQRCEVADRYCDTKVSGVYVGWRGRSFTDCKESTCAILAAPTFWSRKAVSDGPLAQSVVSRIQKLNAIIKDDSLRSNEFASRTLVVGHSLGGNLLAIGLERKIIKAVKNHTPSAVMEPLLGDLVVLLNPAAEGQKWASIQRAVQERSELAEEQRFNHNVHSLFPDQQPPILMSLTSACNWPPGHRSPDLDRKIACDTVTGSIFPLHKMLIGI